MIELDELVQDFLIESCENLDRIDRDLVVLEKSPGDLSIVAGVFRSIHSIKGACGFLGFTRLESVSHVGENLLSKLRTGELSVTEEITSSLLSLVDAVRSMLGDIEKTGKDGNNEYSGLVAELSRLQALENSHQVQSPVEPVANNETQPIESATSEPKTNAKPVSSLACEPVVPELATAVDVLKTNSLADSTKPAAVSLSLIHI